MSFTYTVDENKLIKIFSNTQQEPVIVQPNWPNGTQWTSIEEASNWAELCIASMENQQAPYAPAGPNIPAENKPNN